MSLEDDFQAAVDRMNATPSPSPQIQLQLYGLFKQAKVGDNAGKRPGITKVRERAKFDAWEGHKGMSKEDAMKKYMELAEELSK